MNPGRCRTAPAYGIDNTFILALWNTLSVENRAVLEDTLRELPLRHFQWLEKLLQYLEIHGGRTRRGRGYSLWVKFNDIVLLAGTT